MSETVELTEAEKESLGVGWCGPCEQGTLDVEECRCAELLWPAVARIKAAARREALLEAAEHCTARANEAHRCDLHVVSDTWDVAAVDLRALAEPERDEEGGRCTELTCPQHGPANRDHVAEADALRKQVEG
ncbi:MAG TPA: hypothetical protein VJL80_14605 [Aeromicrobium sp.]|nr:hypothetical protein [Aeromicrobium sp.]HKY59265.1 hypothetical protein [Aeromicrobium sp.]